MQNLGLQSPKLAEISVNKQINVPLSFFTKQYLQTHKFYGKEVKNWKNSVHSFQASKQKIWDAAILNL